MIIAIATYLIIPLILALEARDGINIARESETDDRGGVMLNSKWEQGLPTATSKIEVEDGKRPRDEVGISYTGERLL